MPLLSGELVAIPARSPIPLFIAPRDQLSFSTALD